MSSAARLAEQLEETRKWTLMLIADLKGDDWGFQPAKGLAHPLWLCGHLAMAQNGLIFKRCLGRDELDATFVSHFLPGGAVASLGEHPFPRPEEVLQRMEEMQSKSVRTVREMSDSFLAEPAFAADGKSPHPHYRDKYGAIAHVARHEAFHAGQIATLRRLLGKSFLR